MWLVAGDASHLATGGGKQTNRHVVVISILD